MKKRTLAILFSLLLLVSLTACGGGGNYSGAASQSAMTAEAPAAPAMDYAGKTEGYWNGASAAAGAGAMDEASDAPAEQGGSGLPEGVKMIYRANLELETTEYEQADAQIRSLTKQFGGYFEEQNAYTRSGGYRTASYIVRVPAEQFEAFLAQLGNVCTVVRQGQSAEDVSEYYYDMESRLETQRIKLDRLQDLLSRAELMEDIITLESAISETEYMIESLSGELRHYDALIGYSTINVSLSEVYRVTEVETAPLTFGERMAAAFRDGLRNFGNTAENFLEWLAYSWLSLLVFIVIVVVVVKLIRRGVAKRATGVKREKRGLFRKKDKENPAQPPENKE